MKSFTPLFVFVLMVAGCEAGEEPAPAAPDAGPSVDSGRPDLGQPDLAPPPDTRPPQDAGPDTVAQDTLPPPDTRPGDAGTDVVPLADGGTGDTVPPPDAGTDRGPDVTPTPDSGTPDTGSIADTTPPADSITISLVVPPSSAISLLTDITPEGPVGWEAYIDNSVPFSWELLIGPEGSTPVLYRLNFFRTPAGDHVCNVPGGGNPTCSSLPTMSVNGVAVIVLVFDMARTAVPAGQAAVIRDPRDISGNVAAIAYCRSAMACPIVP